MAIHDANASVPLVAQSGTVIGTGQMLVAVPKQGAQPHPAESRSDTRPTQNRRKFCLFVNGEASCGAGRGFS